MDERVKPLVFIDREGRPGGGEGSSDKQGQDLHPEWIEAASADVGGDGWSGC